MTDDATGEQSGPRSAMPTMSWRMECNSWAGQRDQVSANLRPRALRRCWNTLRADYRPDILRLPICHTLRGYSCNKWIRCPPTLVARGLVRDGACTG